MPGFGQIAKLVAGLIDGGALDKVIQSKLDNIGEDYLKKVLSGGFGSVAGLPKFRTNASFDGLRKAWFEQAHGAAKGHEDFLEKLFSTVERVGETKSSGGSRRKRARWTKTEWARSRQDWLDNKWKHDWRTQPRDAVSGRWLPGRLDNVAATLRYQGSKAGRRTLRRRKQRRTAKLQGRRAARKLFKSLKR
jgi:hypothetical protein